MSENEQNSTVNQNEPEKKPKVKIYKKWWFWVAIVVVAIIIGVVAGTSGDSGSDTPDTNNDSVTTQSPDTSGKKEVAAKKYIGDTITVGDFKITLNETYNTTTLGSEYLNKHTQNNYVVIQVILINISGSEKTVTDSDFTLKNGNARYEVSTDATYLDDGFWLSESIGSGITKSFYLVFETPQENIGGKYTLSFTPSWTNTVDIVVGENPAY